ncbi:MAG: 16S rRNA (adenine(1518)-N(6)/adenine(1519)-N(6))-dimethyltransferase RsmA [Tissierellia bacterium]|nr:16S rRNA (adenine(1518)-N(6)/adenine(1519)-N(6))-dimethyltransferase RsmA [Tissierellia bacterium]
MDGRLYQPKTIHQLVEEFDFRFTKSLGQNFLIDGNVIRKIADAAQVSQGDAVLEIGAGIGVLTEEMALRGAQVLCVEIDESLRPILKKTLGHYPQVTIHYQDILKVDLRALLEERFGQRPVKVVANLPYYVTTPILRFLLREDYNIQSIHVMVQREMAQRLVATSGKDYGSISVYMQLRGRIEKVLNVPASCFMPAPRVDSAVLAIVPKFDPLLDYVQLEKIVRGAFSKRRKTLLNALSTYGLPVEKSQIEAALLKTGIDPKRRAETLSPEDYIRLGANFPKISGGKGGEHFGE